MANYNVKQLLYLFINICFYYRVYTFYAHYFNKFLPIAFVIMTTRLNCGKDLEVIFYRCDFSNK